MEKLVSLDKKYKTRDGRDVRLYAVDGNTPFTVHGSVNRVVKSWTSTGKFWPARDSNADLIEQPETFTRTVWVNVYPSNSLLQNEGTTRCTKERADQFGGNKRIACVQVTITGTVGEGL